MRLCDCPACRLMAEFLGPVQGCEPPPKSPAELSRLARWSMSPEEWAGEVPAREWD